MRSLRAAVPLLLSHRRLLAASYTFDLVYVSACLLYLFLPVTLEGLSPANLGFLGLGAMAAFLYHIHIIRAYTGGPAFYLTVPANRWLSLAGAYTAVLLPFCVVFPIVAHLISADPAVVLGSAYIPVYERTAHCLVVFFFLKVLSPVVLVMTRTHPALLLLLPIGLAVAWTVGTIVGEFAADANVGAGAFYVLVAVMAVGTVAKAKL